MYSPLLSNGTRVLRLTVPARPPSIISAVTFLATITEPSSSAGTSEKPSWRPPLAEKASRPLNSPRTKFRPRMTTPEPSTEKWSGSFEPAKRLIDTPGTRCRASVTERSGRAPISSAVMASTMVSASRRMFCELASCARKPETTITFSPSATLWLPLSPSGTVVSGSCSSSISVVAGLSCAKAGAPAIRPPMTASDAPARSDARIQSYPVPM